ncbi:MAG: hypothetical protein ABW139_17430 [Candidatus Thiodiazotropha sp. DIVDIV]
MNTVSKWRNLAFFFKFNIPSLLILLLLSACDSSVSNTSNTDDNTEDSGRYLLYTSGFVDEGNLIAIDPDKPGSSIPVETGNDIVGCGDGIGLDLCSFAQGNYESSTTTVSDFTPDSLVYIKTDGNFYKVSARKSDDLTPEQLSSETEAHRICRSGFDGGFHHAEDFSDINNSQLVYHLPGTDGDCLTSEDNTWKMIRLGMTASDTPIDAIYPLASLTNLDSDASLSGWLVNDRGSLRRCDENFLNCGSALVEAESSAWMVFGLGRNSYLLEIDGQIFVYNGITNSLSNSIFTPPENEVFSNYGVDESYIYIMNSNKFYRAPIDGSSTATVIAEEVEDASLFIIGISLTENRLIYSKSSGTGNDAEIKAVDKMGGVPITLATIDDGDRALFFTHQNLIYYYFYEQHISSEFRFIPLHAGIMDEDGNVQFEARDAMWVGFTKSQRYHLGENTHNLWPNNKAILGEITNREIVGMSLRGFDGATGNELIDLGALPDLQDINRFHCYTNMQEDLLCEASFDLTPNSTPPADTSQDDIFYLNASTSGSLVRVTETTETSEAVVIH